MTKNLSIYKATVQTQFFGRYMCWKEYHEELDLEKVCKSYRFYIDSGAL